RDAGGDVRGLLAFGPAPVHAVDAAGPGAGVRRSRRAVTCPPCPRPDLSDWASGAIGPRLEAR
ncbi:hypothetical protein B7767_28265, partial [Streptomyces sp. 13-12-16]